jgi:hypothetical protein
VKGSVSLRLRHIPCLLLILGFHTKLNKDHGFTTPIEVAAVGAWLVVGERVGAPPQKGTIVVETLAYAKFASDWNSLVSS